MMKISKKCAVFAFGANLLMLAAPGPCEESSMKDFFAALYDEPVIERHQGGHTDVFPSLSFYSVFEKRMAVEDPLIPDLWIRDSKGCFFQNNEISTILMEEGLFPENREQAITYAKQLIMIKYGVYSCITNTMGSPGVVPAFYLEDRFLPKVREEHNSYLVVLHFFHPRNRYASFHSLYTNALVEYRVTIDSNGYKVETGRVYTNGKDQDEIRLTDTLVDHLLNKQLMEDLAPWLEKRAIYGISDPPDAAGVEQRQDELTRLYEEGFGERHPDIRLLARQVLAYNPDFSFDLEDILLRTASKTGFPDEAAFMRALETLLQEILEREGGKGMHKTP